MSQFTAPAGILGRPDFSGDDYTLQAFQNLSNTLGQLATTNAKREVEQAYEYGLMVEQLGAEEAKNASEFGKLVDQGKVSNLANSWIEVGGQVGRAKKDFISWSTMAEENMNLSLDSDQFGLRNGDNSEQAYTDWKASVLADQRQQMNGAGYYYGKTFGGLLDKWESEFKPKFLQTRAALQRADITDGLQFEILELSKKGRNALPNSLIDIQGKLQDTNLRGALGNNGVRDAVFEQLHLLSRDPKTAVFAHTMIENIKESSGTTLKRNYAKELAASKPQRDEALSKALADEFGDMAYTTISGYLDNNMETDFTSIVNAADPLLSEEDRNVQLLSAVQQAAFDLKEFEDVDGAVELIARLEQTETPDGSTYGEEMGRELAHLRNRIENSQDRLLGSDLRKKQLEEVERNIVYAIGNAAKKLQDESISGGVIVSERDFQRRIIAEFQELTNLNPEEPFVEAALNKAFTIDTEFSRAFNNIGEDPKTLGADAYERAIKVGGTQGATQLEAELETNQVAPQERNRIRDLYNKFIEDRAKARSDYEVSGQNTLRQRMEEAGVPFDGKMPGDASTQTPSNFLIAESDKIYNEALAVLDERLTDKVNELQKSGLIAGEGTEYNQEMQKVVDEFLEEYTTDVMTNFDSYESIASRIQRSLGLENIPKEGLETDAVPETNLDDFGVFKKSFSEAFDKYNNDKTPANYKTVIDKANAFLKVEGVGGVQTNEMGDDLKKAYAAARALSTSQPLTLEELQKRSFTNGVKLQKANVNPRIQLFVSSRGVLDIMKEQIETSNDINKTKAARFVTELNKAMATDPLLINVRIEDVDEFIKFQEELLTRRGM